MNIEEVSIDIQIPCGQVRIVAMQPFIKFQIPTVEPFRWATGEVDKQMSAISRTLELARNGFGGEIANFTLFPEYSIPGVEGARLIDNSINNENWANESIIIAGIDGLNKTEFKSLCQELNVHVSDLNSPDVVPDGKWVNCCVTWVKDKNGMVKKWVQIKIRPAWLEMAVANQDMFIGSSIFLFKAKYQNDFPCNFFTLICFDWVATNPNTQLTVCHEVLNELNIACHGINIPIHWVFVIQHNPRPNHQSFLDSTYKFLNNTDGHHFVDRSDSVVIHVNTAATTFPSHKDSGAFTACVFSPRTLFDCNTPPRPTINMQPAQLRRNATLSLCKDVVFREMGECIHVFKVIVPKFLRCDVPSRTYPIPEAKVYAINTDPYTYDPRLCGDVVPAVVKWINDTLDDIDSLGKHAFLGCPLKTETEKTQPVMISKMRALDSNTASKYIDWATCSFKEEKKFRKEERQQNADIWDNLELAALEHIIYTLTLLGLAYNIIISESSLHCTLVTETTCMQIVAIRGETFEDCRRHFDSVVPKYEIDPVVVFARNRDNDRLTSREHKKFYEVDSENNIRFYDYQNLATFCRDAEDLDMLRRCLDELLPEERRII